MKAPVALVRWSVPILVAVSLLASGTMVANAGSVVLVAGDIAQGSPESMEAATANLVRHQAGLVLTAGDNAYRDGRYREFMAQYDPTWGRFLNRTRPTPGNHDYRTPGANGYFRYFGWRAGPERRGYYSMKVGSWRVFMLNSEACKRVGCGRGSPEYRWLKEQLAKSKERCTLAVWHRPRFSSGEESSDKDVRTLYRLLYQAGAEVVVNGHAHDYERLAPLRPTGELDRQHGIRQFVVGTGGAQLEGRGDHDAPSSRVFESETYGVLKLKLRKDSYVWRFLPIEGQTFDDHGVGKCHGRP